MNFVIDAQLPPGIADWLTQTFSVVAVHVRDLAMREPQDMEIFQYARQPGYVVMSKDEDFVDLATRLGPPPQILWVTCGNVTNRALRELFAKAFPAARALLKAGEPIVESTSK